MIIYTVKRKSQVYFVSAEKTPVFCGGTPRFGKNRSVKSVRFGGKIRVLQAGMPHCICNLGRVLFKMGEVFSASIDFFVFIVYNGMRYQRSCVEASEPPDSRAALEGVLYAALGERMVVSS